MYFVCSYSKKVYNNIKKPITFSDIGKPLEVRYNWEGVKKDIDVDDLLDDDMSSNFEINVIEHTDITDLESPLENAEIVGDISQEVDM